MSEKKFPSGQTLKVLKHSMEKFLKSELTLKNFVQIPITTDG